MNLYFIALECAREREQQENKNNNNAEQKNDDRSGDRSWRKRNSTYKTAQPATERGGQRFCEGVYEEIRRQGVRGHIDGERGGEGSEQHAADSQSACTVCRDGAEHLVPGMQEVFLHPGGTCTVPCMAEGMEGEGRDATGDSELLSPVCWQDSHEEVREVRMRTAARGGRGSLPPLLGRCDGGWTREGTGRREVTW